MAQAAIQETLKLVPAFLRMKFPHAWFDYDEQADVLYVSFERPQQATDSELADNNVLIRKRGDKIVGLTVMQASRFNA